MKTKVGIIGSGNIGMDLLCKIQKSSEFECGIFAGKSANSHGLQLAKSWGVPVSDGSIDAIVEHAKDISIVFDATSAESHFRYAGIYKQLGLRVVDLTPAKVGKMCIPVLNGKECLNEDNVNMVTCGGQATVPIAYAIRNACTLESVEYMEIVATIASRSAGIGTRRNIDEFTQTTKDALAEFTGVKKTKAIIILNSALPEIHMRNTLYCYVKNPNMEEIREQTRMMVRKIKSYVPGYNMVLEPVLENGRITTTVEVLGSGDYLPQYAGNLDIITCAALALAKEWVKKS